jgi:abortive infection bacteriophage resistance protein
VSPGKTPFQKPWLAHADQVRLLRDRGLVVTDPAGAERFLSHLNYYRFSGYGLAFEVRRHEFVAGTTFEQIVGAYQFDLVLRDLLTEALEVVEVELRSAVAYHFGRKYGAFGHTDAVNFFPGSKSGTGPRPGPTGFDHAGWLTRVREETERSSELFIKHFRQTCVEYPDLPVWVVTEVMSFGGLSRMYSGLRKDDQKQVSVRYGFQAHVMQKAIHHWVYVRNLCAHHSRLWDRIWDIKPELPAGRDWESPLLPGNNRLFCTLLLLWRTLRRIPAIAGFAGEWRQRVNHHLAHAPETPNAKGLMGLTTAWDEHPVWVS